jgi:hypothetical protein
MLSRAEAIAFREQTRALAMQIGLRPAARALGLNEERVKKWGQRFKWNIGLIRPASNAPINAKLSPTVPNPLETLANVMAIEGDRTRSAMARTARRAFEHCDTLTDEELHKLDRAIALEKHGRNASVAHQWSSSTSTVAVQVNIPLPSTEEREEMAKLDAKLDAIAAKLRD